MANQFPPEHAVWHEFKFKVEAKHLDALQHVNNVVYLQWVNDASEQHWSILSNDELNSKYVWVALRHEIDYLKQAFLGDEIRVLTWVGESAGVKSIRHVHIYNQNQLLTRSQSTWCLIDIKSKRPTRIKDDILSVITN